MAKDFYKTLGVDNKADEKDIKKAYRKLARKFHPDINPNNPGAEARFKEINEAYQVLSNAEKRALYDQWGDNYDKIPPGYTGGPGPGAGGGPGGPGPNFADYFNQGQGGAGGGNFGNVRVENVNMGEAGDLFETLLGGFGGGRGRGAANFNVGRRRAPQKGEDLEQPISVTLGESIRGTQREFQIVGGDGAARSLTVKIPAGVREGARVRAARQGGEGSGGGARGDLYLRVHIEGHPFWKREGDDLHCEVPVTVAEAALGAAIEVPTMSGSVQLRIPAGTQGGQTFRLSGRGVKRLKGGGAGDEYVKVKIAIPRNLSERENELIEELARLRPEDARSGLGAAL